MNAPYLTDTAASWSLVYDGPEVVNNTIDVMKLTSSLQALNRTVMRANEITNDRSVEASLRIHASSKGSVEIELLLHVLIASNLLRGDFIASATALRDLLIGNSDIPGVFQVFKNFRGSVFDVAETTNDSVILEAKELKMVVPPKVFEIAKDAIVWHNTHETIASLRTSGIDKISIRDSEQELLSFEAHDLDKYDENDKEEETNRMVEIPRVNLTIVAPNLYEANAKWRMNDGHNTQWYSIRDESFLEMVDQGGIRFGSGDVLVCSTRIKHNVRRGNISTEYEIIRIIDHQIKETQPTLV